VRGAKGAKSAGELQGVLDQIEEIERGPDAGRLRLPDGQTLDVGNLRKVFWPTLTITKGELMRYYVRVSPFILPVVSERPLIMKRFPNGIEGKAFYQQRAPGRYRPGCAGTIPRHRRPAASSCSPITLLADELPSSRRIRGLARARRILPTSTSISTRRPGYARACSTWHWVRDELGLNVECFRKTSGASDPHLHPLRKGTPHEAGQIFCKIVATVVAAASAAGNHRARSPGARPDDHVDTCEYRGARWRAAAPGRASLPAPQPLMWKEVDEDIDPRDFTIRRSRSLGHSRRPVGPPYVQGCRPAPVRG
jgi:bifunctional non-homologous end joining protein LigD